MSQLLDIPECLTKCPSLKACDTVEIIDKKATVLSCDKHGILVQSFLNWVTKVPRLNHFLDMSINSSGDLAKLLGNAGTGFTCAHKRHIRLLVELGISPLRIYFGNSVKQRTHIAYAREVGVQLLSVAGKDELVKISEVHPGAKCLLKLNIRTDLHAFDPHTGAPLNDASALIRASLALNLQIVGAEFDCFDICHGLERLIKCLWNIRTIFEQFEKTNLVSLKVLHIGRHHKASKSRADEIVRILDTIYPNDCFPDIRIITDFQSEQPGIPDLGELATPSALQ